MQMVERSTGFRQPTQIFSYIE